jgi:hypothetical protein
VDLDYRQRRGLSLGLAVLLALGTTPLVSVVGRAAEAGSTNAPNPLLTVERIFKGGEFGGEGFGGHWLEDSSGYVTWEKPASGGPGQDLVRHDPATDKRDVLLAASELIPAGKTQPLSVDDYAWSTDRSKVLIYTNSKKVWRTHARGDYWVLDRTSHELFQLGGAAPASSLQFAKFSPDGTHVAYVRERKAFGKPIGDLQNTRFKLAEVATTIQVGRAFIDRCVEQLVAGKLDTATASMAKLWGAEQQGKVLDECLQLFGGYGFMNEYMITRMYADARVQRIYGGTSEIMKEVISRAL